MDSMSGPTKRFKWSRNSNCLVSSCWGTRHSTAWATLQQVCHFSSYVAFKRNVISPRMLSILHVLFMPLSTSGVDGWYWFDSCFISNAMKRQRWSLLWWLAKKQKKNTFYFLKYQNFGFDLRTVTRHSRITTTCHPFYKTLMPFNSHRVTKLNITHPH